MNGQERVKILSLLGLARRAGRIVSGQEKAENAIRSGTARLVIVTVDASDNTRKLFFDKCSFYHIPVYCFFTMDELGNAIGAGQRACVAVNDEGFADKIENLLKDLGQEVIKWQN